MFDAELIQAAAALIQRNIMGMGLGAEAKSNITGPVKNNTSVI
jgi:hypothetical protein